MLFEPGAGKLVRQLLKEYCRKFNNKLRKMLLLSKKVIFHSFHGCPWLKSRGLLYVK
jgi:hypothetical protein